MMNRIILLTIMLLNATGLSAQMVTYHEERNKNEQRFELANEKITCTLLFSDNILEKEHIGAQSNWLKQFGTSGVELETDGDFAFEVMWAGWRVPGNANNGDNFTTFTKEDFFLDTTEVKTLQDGSKDLIMRLSNPRLRLNVVLNYRLQPNSFFIRRKVAIEDTVFGRHQLHWIWPRHQDLVSDVSVVKDGGFGQPIAFLVQDGGAFIGLEYPAAQNLHTARPGEPVHIRCGQEIGEKITDAGIESEWTVLGLSPNHDVKLSFFNYLNDIRVAKLKPYLLYNSWYDLRSPEYPGGGIPQQNIMNEQNVFHMIDLIRKNMTEKYDIQLDAFVLDDGWDTYDSDWVLREDTFPRGMQPIAAELRKTNTDLGIWFGPTGGYSHRMRRIKWMKEHGYETVGEEIGYNRAMLCFGGEKYSALFRKRVVDFVKNDGVRYFKWDGIQFSCSEGEHGHPTGVYSRRAVMESVIDKCRAVRANHPEVFLNITSGTWLSPWWLKYANQVWMDGRDYGYAAVPAISKRDAAMTYRDIVLHQDFVVKDLWMPIANLMTHGIIKGNLQRLGGEAEPLDKFTDNAVLYFARGVSMWELYISPDILNDGEWQAIAESIHWAKDRFDVLQRTEMIGGNPVSGEPYGYAHFSGDRGVIALRNPGIEPREMFVRLAPSQGLDPDATSLVLERVYPSRWISPKLYASGAGLNLQLGGFETAIYEVYPLESAKRPLLAGATFSVTRSTGSEYALKIYEISDRVRIHNPEQVTAIKHNGQSVSLADFVVRLASNGNTVHNPLFQVSNGKARSDIKIGFELQGKYREAQLSVLVKNDRISTEKTEPRVRIVLNGQEMTPTVRAQEGAWSWYTVDVQPGAHRAEIRLQSNKAHRDWTGSVSAWLVGQKVRNASEISFEYKGDVHERPMPPHPFPAEVQRVNVKLGQANITLK